MGMATDRRFCQQVFQELQKADTHKYAHKHTRTHTHTHTHAHAHAHRHTHMDTCAHAHTQTHTHTHADAHAHAQTHSLVSERTKHLLTREKQKQKPNRLTKQHGVQDHHLSTYALSSFSALMVTIFFSLARRSRICCLMTT